jgi:eukaryotic-like serine/threonine-protein kinase
MTGCSSDMMLARLLDEQLDEADHASIVDHVESCVCCQERLKELTSDCSRLLDIDELNRSFTDPGLTIDHPVFGSSGPASRNLSCFKSKEDPAAWHRSDSELPEVEGYKILAVLGHGGMGVVYKAHQERLSRFVALKMIRAGSLAKPEDLARFRIEAEAVAKQRHPNIIQIFDIGEVGGLPFVALELLEGGSLDAFLGGTPQPGESSARLSATLASAVHAAHQAGIIHRDLKPSNVMFTKDGIPKIMDFGLAKRLEEEGYTETGQVLGSPSYIPPEQAQGRAKEVGPEADVYALGAILYEMLTGRPPFKGTTPVATVMQVLNEDPVPPSHLQSQVPRDLETICLKCLAKEPHKRYRSALALADDLDRYLASRPIQARRTPILERGFKCVRRRPISSLLLAFGAVVMSIGLINWFRSQADYRAARIRYEAGLTRYENDLIDGHFPIQELSRLETSVEADPRLADLHLRAVHMLRKAQEARDERQSQERATDRLREFLRRRDDALFQDTQLTGLDASENVAVVRKSTKAALELFAADGGSEKKWTLTRLPDCLTEDEREEVVRGCYEMLMVLAEAVGQPLPGESSTAQARAALQILERAVLLQRQPTHAYHLRRAVCLERAGDAEEAKHERLAAERIQPDGAFDHFLTGLERYKRGYMNQAKRHFAEALQAQPNHFWGQCLLAICDLNTSQPNTEGARAYLNGCLQSHPELPWLYILRGFASGQIGSRASNPAEAVEHFADAEADYREALRRDSGGRYRYALLVNRGLVRFQSGNLNEAVADLHEAISLDPRQLNAYVTLAQIHRQRHQLDLALETLDRAIALEPNLAPLYRTRARWNLERPQVTPAVRAVALSDLVRAIQLGMPNSHELAKDHAERGRLLLLDRQFQQALDACDAALRIDPKDAEVHRYRVGALLELKRDQEAIDACDAALGTGVPPADLLGLRGLARARRNDLPAAIDDYTLALSLQPSSAVLHGRRGWAYVVSGAPQLALRDFEEAIRLDPSSGDAYSGRGSALVALGRFREAVSDAEESLRHGESEARMHYSAARILAQAAEFARPEPRARKPSEQTRVQIYQDRALTLLGQAVERTSPGERATFWREVVHSDRVFTAIRRMPTYARIAAAAAVSQAH